MDTVSHPAATLLSLMRAWSTSKFQVIYRDPISKIKTKQINQKQQDTFLNIFNFHTKVKEGRKKEGK